MQSSKKQVDKKLKKISNLSPEYLYFPIDSRNHLKYFINSKSDIFKEDPLYDADNQVYYSPVSGNALGTKKIGDKNTLVIQNNFKEKYHVSKSLRKKINKLSKKEIVDILTDNHVNYYSSNINYFINNYEKIDSLVLNLLVCEEAQKVYSYVFNEYSADILEIFDAISQVFDIKTPIIIISDNDEKNIEYITNVSGMYPNFKLVLSSDKYPASHPLLIARKLDLKKSLVLTSMDLYYLCSIIKKDKKVLEKQIFITGKNLDKDYLVDTKLNVLVSDILNLCKIKLKENEIICKNSAIKGELINPSDIIDISVDSLTIVDRQINEAVECINCGLCNKMCPQKLNPQLYKLSGKVFPGSCINCNMCSYVCPSKIGRER